MRFHKAAASKDDSVAKVANSAAQPFLEREFAVLLLNDLLSLGQFKCRRVVFAGGSAPQKRVLAILSAKFRRAGCLWAGPE